MKARWLSLVDDMMCRDFPFKTAKQRWILRKISNTFEMNKFSVSSSKVDLGIRNRDIEMSI